MKPLRVLSIIGTRPEAVKMAPVVQKLSQTPGIESLVCVTAQHREMLDQVLNLFEIVPEFDLDLMQPDQSLAQITAAIFTNLDPVLRDLRPDWVLAQGEDIVSGRRRVQEASNRCPTRRPEVRARLPPRLLSRARGPGQPGLPDEEHAEGRRRRHAGLPRGSVRLL